MTNETAEQLREDIERIVHRWKYTCTIPHEDFEEIINKVLDAVMDGVKTEYRSDIPNHPYNVAFDEAIDVINKLRP